MNAAAIRAGQAFVEMYIDDASVQASVERLKTRIRSLGETVNTVGSESFSSVNVAATAATVASTAGLARTTTAVGVLQASVGVLTATLGFLATSAKTAFGIITSSVFLARGSLALLTFGIDRFAKGTKLQSLFAGFLNRSQQTEAIGRWAGFWGALSGSPAIQNFGNRIERLGLAAGVTRAFRSGGISSGIAASFGSAFRSARSSITQTGLSVVGSVFRTVSGTVRASAAAVIPALNQTADASGKTAASMTQASGAARIATTSIAGFARAVFGAALRVGGFAAAISGPAILATKSFVAAAQEMIRVSKETGESLDSLIAKKYGTNSLISPADVQAAAELGDTMTQLKQSVAAAWAQIGIAALPVLRRMTESALAWSTAVVRLLRDNRALIGSIVSVAARVATIATAIGAAGGAVLLLGPALSFLLSPIGLVVAGIGLIAYAFPELRKEALAVFNFLFGNFGELLAVVRDTIGGIQDALMGGNITAAANVLWAGLKLAWLAGTEQLRDVWRQLTNNIASFGVKAFSGLRTAWVVTTKFLGDAWQVAMGGMRTAWQATQNWFARGFARVIANVSGQDVNEVLATLNEMQQQQSAANNSAFAAEMAQREQLAAQKLADIETERQAMQSALDEELEGRRTAAQAELQAARDQFSAAREAARALRPELQTAAAEPAKQKQADASRLVSSNDIRSSEGLTLVLKNLFGSNAAEQTAQNTAKGNVLMGGLNAKLERSNEFLDRIWREQGSDVVSLNAATGAA